MSFSENICLVIILNLTKTTLLHPTSEKRIFGKTTGGEIKLTLNFFRVKKMHHSFKIIYYMVLKYMLLFS